MRELRGILFLYGGIYLVDFISTYPASWPKIARRYFCDLDDFKLLHSLLFTVETITEKKNNPD